MNRMPLIQADLAKLHHNVSVIRTACQKQGVSLAAVTKVVCADGPVTQALLDAGVDMLADSRLENLQKLPAALPRLYLRIADPEEAEETVRRSEFSLQSGVEAVKALGAAARGLGRLHRVILMIDLGDLREGIHYRDEALIRRVAAAVLREDGLELAGIGTNLTCFGGILPDEHNLGILLGIARNLRQAFGIQLPLISGGNSSSLHLLFEGRLPPGINHLRIGESLMLGMDTSSGLPFPQLSQRVFTLFARLVEVYDKPSMPEGSQGPNAFGEQVSFRDHGPMRRGILAIGRQDTDPERLTPLEEGVTILGASSDHLLVDLTRARPFRVGEALGFTPGYGALLKAYTSPYVSKSFINLEGIACLD